jgi:hypothetical protein
MKAINLFIQAIIVGMGFTIGAGIVVSWIMLIRSWLQPLQQATKYYL